VSKNLRDFYAKYGTVPQHTSLFFGYLRTDKGSIYASTPICEMNARFALRWNDQWSRAWTLWLAVTRSSMDVYS